MPNAVPRRLCLASLLTGVAASGSVRGFMPVAAMAMRSSRHAGVAMSTELHQKLAMPARWKNVHDCERPSRWREELDEHDCKVRHGGSGNAQAEERLPDVGGSSHGADSGYSELVPNLVSMNDFLAASRRASEQNKLLLVKFYSKRCRACLRIAANYRRLARKYSAEIACCEMEQHAAGRALLEELSVSQVPTIQIFDGCISAEGDGCLIDAGIRRLANLECQPSQFKPIVETAIVAAIEARRQGHLQLGTGGTGAAQNIAEGGRDLAEGGRDLAEGGRDLAEGGRDLAEGGRDLAEGGGVGRMQGVSQLPPHGSGAGGGQGGPGARGASSAESMPP